MDTYLFNLSIDGQADLINEDENNDTAELKKRGRIFFSTSLRNINLKKSNLNNFSKLLTTDISSHEKEKSITYQAEISLTRIISGYPSLKIQVERNSDAKSIVYYGLFFAWSDSNHKSSDNLDLPFLFCNGTQKYVTLINMLLQSYFSCTITPVEFSQSEFRWILALAVHQIDAVDKNMQLIYEMRNEDAKFDMIVSFHTIKNWWERIHDDDNQLNYEKVARLNALFEEHFLNVFGFDLSHFHLKTICIPDNLTMNVSGKVLINRLEFTDVLFKFLSQKRLIV